MLRPNVWMKKEEEEEEEEGATHSHTIAAQKEDVEESEDEPIPAAVVERQRGQGEARRTGFSLYNLVTKKTLHHNILYSRQEKNPKKNYKVFVNNLWKR